MLSICISLLIWLQPPSPDYHEVFGEHYTRAVQYLEELDLVSDSIFQHFDVDKEILHAVVFPELIRYSMIVDYLQVASLELVYVNTGLADFSIGKFQIKPSFAERIEKYFLEDSARLGEFSELFDYRVDDPVEIRKQRLGRLKSAKSQLMYLAGFARIMEIRYPDMPEWSDEYTLRFLSTAYNHDFEAEQEEIEEYSKKQFFPWGTSKESVRYNYSDISWFYFNKIQN